jgi:hypothetical protein
MLFQTAEADVDVNIFIGYLESLLDVKGLIPSAILILRILLSASVFHSDAFNHSNVILKSNQLIQFLPLHLSTANYAALLQTAEADVDIHIFIG